MPTLSTLIDKFLTRTLAGNATDTEDIRGDIGAVGTALEITTALQGAEADPTKIGIEYFPDPMEFEAITFADPAGAVLPSGSFSGGPNGLIYRHNGVDAGGVAYRPEPENVIRYLKEIPATTINRKPMMTHVRGTVVSGTYVPSTFTASSVNSGVAIVTNVAVTAGDTATQVAAKIAAALAANSTINVKYSVTNFGPILYFQCLDGTVDAVLTHSTAVGDTSGITAVSIVNSTNVIVQLGTFTLPASYVANGTKLIGEIASSCYFPEALASSPHLRLVFDGDWSAALLSTSISQGLVMTHRRNAATTVNSKIDSSNPILIKTKSGTTLVASWVPTTDVPICLRGYEAISDAVTSVPELTQSVSFNTTANENNTFESGVAVSVKLVAMIPYTVAATAAMYLTGKASIVKVAQWP